jgi:hypothetical protein
VAGCAWNRRPDGRGIRNILDFFIVLLNLLMQAHHHAPEAPWHWMLWIVQQHRSAAQRSGVDWQTDPERQQKCVNLIGREGAMANQ